MLPRAVPFYLLAIIAAGAVLRFYQIDKLSLSHVEAMSYWFSRHSLEELLTFIPILEVIPPLYSLTLKAWSPIGDSEAALRSLSAVVSTLTIPLVFLLGRSIGGRQNRLWIGLGAATLFALSPFQIQYAQESRYPACLTFSVALGLCGMAWLMQNPQQACKPYLGFGGRFEGRDEPSAWAVRLAWLALIIGTVLSLWLHNTPIFFVAALGVAALFWLDARLKWDRRALANLLLAGGLAFLAWTPFLPTLLQITGNISENWWMRAPGLIDIAVNIDILFGVSHLHFAFSFLFVLSALAGFWVTGRRSGWSAACLLAAVAVIPVLLALFVSYLFVPIFLYRTLIWVTVPYYVLLAAGVTAFGALWLRIASLSLLAGLFVLGSLNYYQFHQKQPWNEIVGLIAGNSGPNDLVLVLPNAIEVAFDYYAKRNNLEAPVLVLPRSFPAIDTSDHPYPTDITSGPGIIPADIPDLRKILEPHPRVWLVTWLDEAFDPDDLVPKLLRETHDLVEEREFFEDISVRRFERDQSFSSRFGRTGS